MNLNHLIIAKLEIEHANYYTAVLCTYRIGQFN